MTTTYFFSHDEDGLNFFDDVYSLVKNTPRMEDCYVYVGKDGLKCEKFDYEWDEWSEYRDESMNALDWIEKENEELKKDNEDYLQEKDHEIDELKQENEQLKEQVEEVKVETKELIERVQNIRKEAEEMNRGGWKIIAENEKLKKEKEQLEHTQLMYHCELRWHDPKGNNDSPDKEYVDEYCVEFGYGDKIKQTLYEAFCIDEDEDEDEE